MNIPMTFCKWWHGSIIALFVVGGYVVVCIGIANDITDLLTAIFECIMICIMGTLCFLILPMAFVAASVLCRFAPVIAFPIFAIYFVARLFAADPTPGPFSMTQKFFISLGLSIWGLFNIITAKIANEDPDFNPVSLVD